MLYNLEIIENCKDIFKNYFFKKYLVREVEMYVELLLCSVKFKILKIMI